MLRLLYEFRAVCDCIYLNCDSFFPLSFFVSLSLSLLPSLCVCLWLLLLALAQKKHITFHAERILLSINSYLTKIKLKSHGRKIIDYNAPKKAHTRKQRRKKNPVRKWTELTNGPRNPQHNRRRIVCVCLLFHFLFM